MREHPGWLVAWLCAALTGLGVIVASFGPLLPELAAVTGAPVARVGLLISALFGGTLVSQFVSAVVIGRYGARSVIACSLCAAASGSAGLAAASTLSGLLAAGGVIGLGYGLGSISVNLLAVRMVPSRPGFVVNLCNVCYGLGAVAGPLLSSALLRQGGRASSVLLFGAGLLVVLAPMTLAVRAPAAPALASVTAIASATRPAGLSPMVVFFLLFGGIEAGVSGWLATYAERTLAVTPAHAAVMTSQYWACYLAGRCVSTLVSLRVRPEALLAWATGVLVVGGVCLLASVAHTSGTLAGLGLIGLATGPLFPLAFAAATSQHADQAASAAATVAAAGSIGATVLPWVMGLALDAGQGRGLAATTLILALGMAVALRLNQMPVAHHVRTDEGTTR